MPLLTSLQAPRASALPLCSLLPLYFLPCTGTSTACAWHPLPSRTPPSSHPCPSPLALQHQNPKKRYRCPQLIPLRVSLGEDVTPYQTRAVAAPGLSSLGERLLSSLLPECSTAASELLFRQHVWVEIALSGSLAAAPASELGHCECSCAGSDCSTPLQLGRGSQRGPG